MAAAALPLVHAGDAGELAEGRLEDELAHLLGCFFLGGLEHVVDLLVLEALLGEGADGMRIWGAVLRLAFGDAGEGRVEAVVLLIAEEMDDASLAWGTLLEIRELRYLLLFVILELLVD